jgi:hypothetical protein
MIAPPHGGSIAKGVRTMTGDELKADRYSTLSDEELYEILCRIFPHMHRFSVNELTRETAIAMLRISGFPDLQ